MDFLTPLLIAFAFVFVSELGDKTQLLVLSFSAKLKTVTILLGIAFGSLFSHGIAILFGSFLGNLENVFFQNVLKLITYSSFVIIGLFILLYKKNKDTDSNSSRKFISKSFLSQLKLNYILLIASSIAIGELGDKTFLASIGLGIEYSNYKLSLIIGAVLGMVVSDCIAIFLGKFLSTKLNTNTINKISGILFIIFGIIGLFFL